MQVKINDWNINYEVLGKGNPVILLHGWLATLETMRPVANNLSQNFKVYLVDVVGFGKSDLPEHPLKTDDFGDFLKKFVDELKIENPILIGHSNGGRIIINAVGRGLVKAKKVILIDSAGIKPKRSLGYYIKIAFYKTGKFILNLLPNTKRIKAFKEKLRSNVGSSDYKASANVLKETMKLIVNEDLSYLLPKISVPTLIFWGSLDTATPISDAKKMEKLIPDSGLIEYAGSSHFSYLENLNNFNTVVNEFLKNDK
ncbi:MAG TPA: alpha/beta hydrolase [Candidatus Scatovivens faecipullorum]|nr:alpha/beta hydrolase [Candidatus Scatovivens faecipullorum]